MPVSEPAKQFVGTALVTLLSDYVLERGGLVLIHPEQVLHLVPPAVLSQTLSPAVARRLLHFLLREVQAPLKHICFLLHGLRRAALLGSQFALFRL